jgi:hypothetical protein
MAGGEEAGGAGRGGAGGLGEGERLLSLKRVEPHRARMGL